MRNKTTKLSKAVINMFKVKLPIILLSLVFSAFVSESAYGQCQQIFYENFGTSYNNTYIDDSDNWDCRYNNDAVNKTTDLGACATYESNCIVVIKGYKWYITTKQISLGASGNKLSFDYSFNYNFGNPKILISENTTCGNTGTELVTLAATGTNCSSASFSLDDYANRTIRIIFMGNTGSANFEIDNIIVEKNCPVIEDPVDPTFSFATEYCQGDALVSLPMVSDNHIEGSWTYDGTTTTYIWTLSSYIGTTNYTFTPNPDENANPVTIPVTVNPLPTLTCPTNFEVTNTDVVTLTATPSGGIYTGSGITGNTFSANGLDNGNYLITYTYTDGNTCENSCSFNITVNISVAEPIWTGTISSDWNTAGNWSTSTVPTAGTNALIPAGTPHDPIINETKATPATCNNLTIESGAVLTIAADKALTVNGDLANNGSVYIKSTATGDGSLLLSSISGSGTYSVDRYLEESMWHLVTSPITTGLSGVMLDIWLRAYDEATNTFSEYIVPTDIPMPTGQGFSVWTNTANEIRTFTGTINHGTVGPLNAQLTGSAGTSQGWNLMGNPYPSAIDWNATSGWTKTNIANAIYIWNNNQYATYINGTSTNGGSRYITSGQGFFVQATATNAKLSMTNDIRLHNEVSFKSSSEALDIIRIQISGNDYSDESVIAVSDAGSTSNFNPITDAVKLPGSNMAPQMYTTKDDLSKLSINCLNSVHDIFGKAVYIDYAQDGEHVISWSHTFHEGAVPSLYDNLTATVINPETPYTFIASSIDPAERFTFTEIVLGIDNNLSNINVWENNNILYIQNLTGKSIKEVCVYNMQGQLVMQFNNNVKDLNSLSPAMYVVKVNADENSVVEKVIVK